MSSIFKKEKDVATRLDIFESYSPSKAVFTLAIPTIINSMMTVIYNLVDTFWISRTNDAAMVAGVSLGMSAMLLLTFVGTVFGMGGSTLISRMLGAKDTDRAKRASVFCVYVCAIWGVIMTFLVIAFCEPVATFLGAKEDTMLYTKQYLIWTMGIGAVPTILGSCLGAQMRAEGNAKHEMYGMVGGHILNLVLDPILIFKCKMYVAGAALATMLSSLFALLYFAYFVIRHRDTTVINVNPHNFRVDKKLVYDVLIVGIPSALETLLGSIVSIINNRLLSDAGTNYVSAMGIVQKLEQFPVQTATGFTSGVVPLIGHNYAAKNYDRMESCRKYALKATLAVCLVFVCVYEIWAKPLFMIFLKADEYVAIGVTFIRIHALTIPLMTLIMAIRSTFQAIGKGPRALFVSFLRRGLIYVPVVFALYYTVGVYGVPAAQVVTDAISLVIAFWLYARTRKQFMQEIGPHY